MPSRLIENTDQLTARRRPDFHDNVVRDQAVQDDAQQPYCEERGQEIHFRFICVNPFVFPTFYILFSIFVILMYIAHKDINQIVQYIHYYSYSLIYDIYACNVITTYHNSVQVAEKLFRKETGIRRTIRKNRDTWQKLQQFFFRKK